MKLLESGQMYLETIFILSKTNPSVHSIDVCEYMGFSKPSVSRAVGLLKKGGYLLMASDGSLSLTEEGYAVAEKTYERHQFLTALFERLGVTADIAASDACKIEHDISDDTFEALKRFVEKHP